MITPHSTYAETHPPMPLFPRSIWCLLHPSGLDLLHSGVRESAEARCVLRTHSRSTGADDIPCQPITHVSLLGVLPLAAIGWFRQATMAGARYRGAYLAVVRDPNNRSNTKLVVTPTFGKNKLKLASRVS
ncbi:hypothetical protein BS50DRAFT_573200 [Corynespora cassiicola Philippines]|uniref:Uncharacterized protein n=1 Tax=Corynespora cassiicola Philippines TaxID=1448308 RepID=A0A2T2NSB9_CORCC|nr:hypothetical protein BS50DRAFT_573200 [Corynespora cassiicola Philippines]